MKKTVLLLVLFFSHRLMAQTITQQEKQEIIQQLKKELLQADSLKKATAEIEEVDSLEEDQVTLNKQKGEWLEGYDRCTCRSARARRPESGWPLRRTAWDRRRRTA